VHLADCNVSAMVIARSPYAGNPHVRFDEGEGTALPTLPVKKYFMADMKSKKGKFYAGKKNQKGDTEGNHADYHGTNASVLNIAENGDNPPQD
jgi:hypothetical protein